MRQEKHPYGKKVACAVIHKKPNSVLKSDSVFYGCARFGNVTRDLVREPERRQVWRGKLNSIWALCVALDVEPPVGLEGELIGYECANEPGKPHRGPVTKSHRGDWGRLKNAVVCRILQSFKLADM